jgi:hypothetical protein
MANRLEHTLGVRESNLLFGVTGNVHSAINDRMAVIAGPRQQVIIRFESHASAQADRTIVGANRRFAAAVASGQAHRAGLASSE